MSESSLDQQLLGHLASLRLSAAAEALPGVFDQARAEELGHTAFLECLLAIGPPAVGRTMLAVVPPGHGAVPRQRLDRTWQWLPSTISPR